MKVYLEIDECPRGHGYEAIMLMSDNPSVGRRLTPSKCCGSWRTRKRWLVSADNLDEIAAEFKDAAKRLRRSERRGLKDPCEYDPKAPDGLNRGEQYRGGRYFNMSGCRNRSELIVGANGKWRLCRSCAALPRFKRYRVRKEIKRKGAS